MSKKRSWLCFIKTLFFPETLHHQHQPKMCKRKRWLFGRQKRAKALPLPPPSIQKTEQKESKCKEDEDEQRLTSQFQEEGPKDSEIIIPKDPNFQLIQQVENHVENLSVTKIQTAYRGYLARKALRALKGFVTLQAIIRGRAVRRQAMTTLKCLQAIVNIQSEVCTKRIQMAQIKCRGSSQLQDLRDEKPSPKVEFTRHRRDDRLMSKVDEIEIILRKKEAILRRQRTKAYAFNHRHSADSEEGKAEGRLRHWLDHNVNDQDLKIRNTEGLNSNSNPQILSIHRRSFHNHRKQNSYGEDGFPTYMAATESARAKTRSLSSPRVRPMHLDAPYSDNDSPYKHKLTSPMSSINSELTCSGLSRISNKSSHCSNTLQQKSPSFKGHYYGIVRSSRNLRAVTN